MHQSATTLKKISILTGYSVSTVSKALNDKQDISLETRQTIRSIAKKHNYVPNYYAMALRKQQTKTLAIIIPQISDLFYSNLLSKIQNLSFENGYRLLIFQSSTSQKKEKDCFKLINDGSVDGVLVFSASNNDCIIEKLQNETSVPTVFLNEHVVQTKLCNIEDLAKICFNDLLSKIV